ncbi:hypothetical protein NIES4072_40230 [Nostoc commune NIES-4072]|uniref:Uncharacterized protein n=1 Tax=Nostoc commune NIES-4072 TaxID=2005467 RepID=A0A2R5FNK1_NOSCO|nr:hypothetical protein [Nostoc commune]BBD68655.1 hypothetical protein NIES4070_50550 [Nostoc commune HK-02]GBG20346.1 hypothetical protein NIES4072_40230 [Nostoc commune NIES-4072]
MNQPSVRANLTPEYDYAVIAENFVKELRENRPRRISGLTMTATTTPALTDNKTLSTF